MTSVSRIKVWPVFKSGDIVDFRLSGLDAPAEWNNYSAPGSILNAVYGTSKNATLGVISIKVADLEPVVNTVRW